MRTTSRNYRFRAAGDSAYHMLPSYTRSWKSARAAGRGTPRTRAISGLTARTASANGLLTWLARDGCGRSHPTPDRRRDLVADLAPRRSTGAATLMAPCADRERLGGRTSAAIYHPDRRTAAGYGRCHMCATRRNTASTSHPIGTAPSPPPKPPPAMVVNAIEPISAPNINSGQRGDLLHHDHGRGPLAGPDGHSLAHHHPARPRRLQCRG